MSEQRTAKPAIPVPTEPTDSRIQWAFFELDGGCVECWARYFPDGVDFAQLEGALTQWVTNVPKDGQPVAKDDVAPLRHWLQRACFLRLLQRLWAYNDRRDRPGCWDEDLPWGIASQIYEVRLDWGAHLAERRRADQLASSEALRLAREGFAQRAKLAERR